MSSSGLKTASLVIVIAALGAVPWAGKAIFPAWWELTAHIMIKVFMNIGFGLCLWIMLQAGELSLGQGAFISIGAYVTGILVAKYHILGSIWLGYFLGACVSGVIALLLGSISVHLQRIFFLLVTWAFGEMMRPVLVSFQHPFGGSAGIVDIKAPEGLAFFAQSWTGYYYVALGFALAVFLIIWRIGNSKLGLIYKAIGQNEALVTFSGLRVRFYKLQVFALGCFLSGIGGGIMASYLTAISPETFTFFTSLDIIMFNLIGGMNVIAGPIVGAVFLTCLNELLFTVGYFKMILYGLIIILIVTLLPGGIVSLPALIWKRESDSGVSSERDHG
jgi:branched-chain amino acid transport system permease protein